MSMEMRNERREGRRAMKIIPAIIGCLMKEPSLQAGKTRQSRRDKASKDAFVRHPVD